MGQYADMILEGDVCQVCMCPLEDSLGEFPQTCPSCRHADLKDKKAALHAFCPTCKKRVKLTGLADHTRVVHGSAS